MAIELVTGKKGTQHITSSQHGKLYAGIVGTGEYVFGNIGSACAASIVTANEIAIADGIILMQGREIEIDLAGVSVNIDSGTQGNYRNDLIVVTYNKEATTSLEESTITVIKGEIFPDASAVVDPDYTHGDILNGEIYNEMPLYRVSLNGVNVTAVTPVFTEINSEQSDALQAVRDADSYYGIKLPNGSQAEWLKTTTNGLIPKVNGGSNLGTNSYRFNNIYANNHYIGGNLLSVYIIASGSSGGWRWYTFSNGLTMCWTRVTSANYTVNVNVNDRMYRSAQIASPAYPFAFSSVPMTQISNFGTIEGCYVELMGTTSGTPNGLTRPPNYRLWAPRSTYDAASVSFFVIGTRA